MLVRSDPHRLKIVAILALPRRLLNLLVGNLEARQIMSHDEPDTVFGAHVALDRVRRLVNERRFALGVQLIDRRSDPLDVAAGYARVAEGTLDALGRAAVWEFEDLHGRFPVGELVVVALGRLGGRAGRTLRTNVRPRRGTVPGGGVVVGGAGCSWAASCSARRWPTRGSSSTRR